MKTDFFIIQLKAMTYEMQLTSVVIGKGKMLHTAGKH
jgi:hypothetical protein